MATNLFSQSFAKDRTEDDILAQLPIPLKMGGRTFEVKPLPIRKNKEWRGKLAAVLNDLSTGPLTTAGVTGDSFMKGLMVAFFEFPDNVLSLLVAYAPDVLEPEVEWLMDKATDEEVVVAFSRILPVAYPFFSLLGTMKSAAMAADQAISHQ